MSDFVLLDEHHLGIRVSGYLADDACDAIHRILEAGSSGLRFAEPLTSASVGIRNSPLSEDASLSDRFREASHEPQRS
jgi:hypothetical protein